MNLNLIGLWFGGVVFGASAVILALSILSRV